MAERLSEAGGPAVVLVSTLDAPVRSVLARSGARGFLPKADLTSAQLLELLGPP